MSKHHLKKILAVLTAIYCVSVLGYAFYHSNPTISQGVSSTAPPAESYAFPSLLLVGAEAPDFALPDLNGKMIHLSQFRHHKKVLVEFFATWCPHCQHSAPFLQALQSQFANKLKVLAINSGDKPPRASTAADFKETYKVTYTILDYPLPELIQSYKVTGIPTLYLIDLSGKVLWAYEGVLSEKPLAELKEYLK